MRTMLMRAAAVGIALAAHAVAPAQQKAEQPQSVEEREQATNKQLLAALLKRRAEIAPSGNTKALDFLDRRIAELKVRTAN